MNDLEKLPQVGENNTPRLMDAAEECFLYYEFRPKSIYYSIDVFGFAKLPTSEEEFDGYNAKLFAQPIAKSGYR